MQSWLTETAKRAVVVETPPPGRPGAAKPAPADGPKTSCDLQLDVMSWERLSVPNPEYSSVEPQLKACGRRGAVYEQLCAAGRRAAKTVPRRVLSHKLTVKIMVTPRGAPTITRLDTRTIVPSGNAQA